MLDPREYEVDFDLPEIEELSDIDPRQSHTAKLATAFLVIVVVGVVLSAFTLGSLEGVVQSERTASLSAEATTQGNTVETVIAGLERSTLTVADQTERVTDGGEVTPGVQTELTNVYATQARFKGVSAIYLIEDGTVVASSRSQREDQSASSLGLDVPSTVSEDEAVIRLREGTNPAWVTYTATESGRVVAKVTPVSYVDAEVTSVLDESRTRIVASDGTVLYDSESLEAVGTRHTETAGVGSPAVRAALDGEAGTMEVAGDRNPTGKRVVTGYDTVDATGWAVVSYAEPSALFAAVGVVQRNLLILLGGIGLLLVGFGLAVERPAIRRLQSLRETVAQIEDGEFDATIETDREDEFGDLARGLDTMRTRLRDRIAEAERATQEAEAAKQEAEALSTELEAKAESYRDTLRELADGDFTVRVDADSRHDGMREVGETLNEVIADLEETLAEMQEFADDVADSMELLSSSADQIERSSSDVAETIQSLNTQTKKQRSRLQSVSTEMNDMSATVEEIASTSSEVADGAETAARLSGEGRDDAEDAADALAEIETVTEQAAGEVEQLVKQVEQIEEFADVIGDIAEQTDMLALNANIEAARTDTGADGFAVVADEIKSLATEAGERADDIEQLVGKVSDQTDATADRMATAQQRVRESNDTVQSAIDALIDIGDAVQSTNQGVQDINRATDDQATTTEEVTATVEEVEQMSAKSASEMNQAAAAAEEQTATVSEVARTADEVAEEAETLRDTTAQFTVAPDENGPSPESDSPAAAADGGDAPDE